MDIRGRSNYPFRAPLTGPRLIPPSGRPCVGLTRLSSDRVAETKRGEGARALRTEGAAGGGCGGGARGHVFGGWRRARGRLEEERERKRRGRRGAERWREPGGRQQWEGRARGKRREEREREQGRRERGKTQSRGLCCCCRACADKGNLRLQSLVSPSRLSTPVVLLLLLLPTHTRVHRRHAHTRLRRAIRARARTHACMPCAAETARYSQRRKREQFPESHSSSSVTSSTSFSFPAAHHPCRLSRSPTIYSSSSSSSSWG